MATVRVKIEDIVGNRCGVTFFVKMSFEDGTTFTQPISVELDQFKGLTLPEAKNMLLAILKDFIIKYLAAKGELDTEGIWKYKARLIGQEATITV